MSSSSVKPSHGGGVAVTLESSYLGCFAHAGFMNALLESGIRPSKISGASSGAIIAAAYASGLEGEPLKAFILDRQFQNSFLEWRSLFRGAGVFTFYRRQALVRGCRAVRYLSDVLPVSRIEEATHAELSIGVSNLTRKERQLITRGDMAAFVVASCAVPPVISAQEIEGELYLDGGFTDEAPFEHWIDDPEIHTIIIHQIIPLKGEEVRPTKRSNFITCWSEMHQVAAEELLRMRLDRAKAAGKRVVIHQTPAVRPSLMASKRLALSNYQTGYKLLADHPPLIE